MATSIKVAGATFRRAVASLFLPDRDSLVYEFVFGGDLASTKINLVDGTDALTQIGTPTYNAHSVTISSGAGNNHGFSGVNFPGLDFTIIQIRKKPATFEGSAVFNSPDGSMAIGFVNNHGSGSQLDFWNTLPVSGSTPTQSMPTHTDFFMQAGVGPDLGLGKLFVGTGGAVTKTTASAVGTARFPTPLVIGGGGGAFGSHEIAYAALFNRLLSDGEIDDCYDQLKTAFNDFIGITVS